MNRSTLDRLLDGHSLPATEAERLFDDLAAGHLPTATAGAVLAALRVRGETATEIGAFARAMQRLARVPGIRSGAPLLDIVGTGGDGSGSLNLSTGAGLLAAAAGARVAKHGNRAVSSRCGSADVLEALGLSMSPEAVGVTLERTGFAFLYAPAFHPAMRHIAPIRRTLGVRTVFNLVGPVANPARPSAILLGAYRPQTARLLAQVLALPESGVRRAFVVCGADNWDEPTPVGPFLCCEVADSKVTERRIDPLDYGVPRCTPADLAGGDHRHNAARLRAILGGQEVGPARDAIALGAALGLVLVGEATDVPHGLLLAHAAIDDGRAARVLDDLAGPRLPGTFLNKRRVAAVGRVTVLREGPEPDPSQAPPVRALADTDFTLIAEIKPRSPGDGLLAALSPTEAAQRALAYARGGAHMISVLTEPDAFGGSLDHLRAVAAAVDVPVLRKDFLVDPLQVAEARAAGASAVLILLRMVDDHRLRDLLAAAEEHRMIVLAEAFDRADLERARKLPAQVLVGINARDLTTLQVDRQRLTRLAAVPMDRPVIAESGLRGPADARRLARLGYAGALVGTHLMRAADPEGSVSDLLQAGQDGRRLLCS